jgi:hypothetical protein
MVATEAAGEGINLQFCHLMINFDIPWNPNRLEQRMGRIHRYGQHKEVFVYNFVATDTREGKVMERIFEKLETMKEQLGSDKVYDVIGEILYGKNLYQIIMDAAINARDINEINKDVDIIFDKDKMDEIREELGESLATRNIDYTRIKEMADKAKENRLIPEYTLNFFKRAFSKVGGEIHERKDGFLQIDSIPHEIRKQTQDESFKKRYGTLISKYPRITFDKEIAFKNPESEFITFGHPLFEAVLVWVEKNFSLSAHEGSVFIDPDGKLDGFIIFFEGRIEDGTGDIAGKRLFSVYIGKDEVKPVLPSILWDLAESDISTEEPIVDVEPIKSKARQYVIKQLEDYQSEILVERKRQMAIKEKYGLKSLEYIIVKFDDDVMALEGRLEKGEKVELPLRIKKEQLEKYREDRKLLEIKIRQEKELTMSPPQFVGIIMVKPQMDMDKSMQTDAEIERIGMEIAMKFERANDRIPEDISTQNLGYDIRSTDADNKKRFIEVKARAGTGSIAITLNEWFKAQRFKQDYYLYVILKAGSKPVLYIVQNPAEKIAPDEKVEIVRYIVAEQQILEYGEIHEF